MQENSGNTENVTRLMEEFRITIKNQLTEALNHSSVREDEAYENFHKTCNENPHAIVKIDANQAHLYIVVLSELDDLLEEELQKRGSHGLLSKQEVVRGQLKHEFDHAGVLWRHEKRVNGFGVLMCWDKNGLPQGIPFLDHEKVRGEIEREMIMAPEVKSPGDLKILSES